jgi:hypothetical protein
MNRKHWISSVSASASASQWRLEEAAEGSATAVIWWYRFSLHQTSCWVRHPNSFWCWPLRSRWGRSAEAPEQWEWDFVMKQSLVNRLLWLYLDTFAGDSITREDTSVLRVCMWAWTALPGTPSTSVILTYWTRIQPASSSEVTYIVSIYYHEQYYSHSVPKAHIPSPEPAPGPLSLPTSKILHRHV